MHFYNDKTQVTYCIFVYRVHLFLYKSSRHLNYYFKFWVIFDFIRKIYNNALYKTCDSYLKHRLHFGSRICASSAAAVFCCAINLSCLYITRNHCGSCRVHLQSTCDISCEFTLTRIISPDHEQIVYLYLSFNSFALSTVASSSRGSDWTNGIQRE